MNNRQNLTITLITILLLLLVSCTPVNNDPEITPMQIAFSTTDIKISGLNDGTIDLTVSGGQGPYTYLWSTGNQRKDIGGLYAGVYSVTVTDSQGTQVSDSIQLTEPGATESPAGQIEIKSNGIHFSLIRGGTFHMGTRTGLGDDSPVHRVNLSSFYIGITEVTQAQFQEIMGFNPSETKGDQLPVSHVTWHEAKAFCDRLSEQENRRFRLPSEAEWEYVALGGSVDKIYSWGDEKIPMINGHHCENLADDAFISLYSQPLDQLGTAFIGYHDGYSDLAPVATFLPNGFGVRDIGGNVSEWCLDWYSKFYYSQAPLNNPRGPESGEGKLIRGGSYGNSEPYARIRTRIRDDESNRYATVGFRVLLEIE